MLYKGRGGTRFLKDLRRLSPEQRLNQGFLRNLDVIMSCSKDLPDGMVGEMIRFKRIRDRAADSRSSESDLHAADQQLFNDVMGVKHHYGLAGGTVDCPIVIDDNSIDADLAPIDAENVWIDAQLVDTISGAAQLDVIDDYRLTGGAVDCPIIIDNDSIDADLSAIVEESVRIHEESVRIRAEVDMLGEELDALERDVLLQAAHVRQLSAEVEAAFNVSVPVRERWWRVRRTVTFDSDYDNLPRSDTLQAFVSALLDLDRNVGSFDRRQRIYL